ncbi:sensor domain-containing diguanylate cyclase [Peribacillus asahii]|uniref:Uncharacterized protein n=1 Tax=Peribacillus asahii TaxID=228899 RepID=A0A3Q9RR54_9BACI|nr:diguanylate cyclase [Peribacillus asahii]AZV44734.1 hypothetical protein BAOM_4127 [Peribacillus asahii]USK84395.1 diguanylate cyclase [Peribacillus asahii]
MSSKITQLLNELRVLFFQRISDVNNDMYSTAFIQDVLLVTKELLRMEEVTYFKYDDWTQQFYMEATTGAFQRSVLAASDMLITQWNQNENEGYIVPDQLLMEIEGFQAFISFHVNHRIVGLVGFKEKTSSTFSYLQEDWLTFSKEFATIMETALCIAKTKHKEQRYKQLYRVTEQFHSSMNMTAVLGEVISTLQNVYPTFDYYLFLSQDSYGHGNLPVKELDYNSENVVAMQAYLTGKLQFEDDYTERHSILYAPLLGKQGVYGVLQIIAPDSLLFPPSELDFITLLANTAGSAIENAQLYQQSKRLVADLQLINETSHYLNSNTCLNDTIQFMKRQIIQSFQANQSGFVLLSNDGALQLLPESSSFFETKDAQAYLSFLKRKMEEEKESQFISDVTVYIEEEDLEYRSLMAVPMMENSSLRGFVVVLHQEPYFFSFDMFKLFQSLIHHSSIAMMNSILREELEKMVITDYLTQLHSRSYLDQQMCESMITDDQGTFILIDIDNFKKVNDTYGHQVGDEILIQVAKVIQRNIRDTDIGARWGGEELAVYLPKVDLLIGLRIAERIKDKVAEQTNPNITISCGVSYWSKERCNNVKELFKRADEALYIAKNTGKNKVLLQQCDC